MTIKDIHWPINTIFQSEVLTHTSLKTTAVLASFFLASVIFSCTGNKISLERVSFLPDYFTAEKHFGKDITSVKQSNHYLFVTGKIDTTSESPPLRMGVISVTNTKIYLNLIYSTKTNDTTIEAYSGNGYNLQLKYTIFNKGLSIERYVGKIIVTNGNFGSAYSVEGEAGYQ